jgi:uncharacterized LabA/DUF88 family protein
MNIALLADVSNLYYCVNRKFNGRKLNYKFLLEKATGDDKLYKACAYGTFLNDDTGKFITALQHLNYETKFIDPKIHTKADGKKEYWNADWSVGITIDVVRLISRVDTVVLASSMVNLVPLVEWIREQSVKTVIMSCGIPQALKRTADRYVELDESYLEKTSLLETLEQVAKEV